MAYPEACSSLPYLAGFRKADCDFLAFSQVKRQHQTSSSLVIRSKRVARPDAMFHMGVASELPAAYPEGVRTPKLHVARDGSRTYRVRYRLGGKETSETFRRERDAETFAALLGNGEPDRVAEALRWLRSKEQERTAYTLGQWFEHYVDQLTGVTDRTRSDYTSLYRRYFRDLGDIPLPLLNRSHVVTIVNDMDRAGRKPKTIKQAIHTLSSCLALAVDEGHITANPCMRVRLPSMSAQVIEPRFMTHEEAAALIAAMPEHYRPLVTFLFGTGMRWSEATAIQSRHVNLDAGTVRVEQAWKRVPGQGVKLGPPKTLKSRRTVNAAVPALLAIQPLLRNPKDLVFVTRGGGHITHSNFFNNVWRPAIRNAGIDPAPRIHDARHSHASWLISDGKSLEAVQDQLGHESILTTRKVYGHLLPALGVEVGRSASAAMTRVLELANANRPVELSA